MVKHACDVKRARMQYGSPMIHAPAKVCTWHLTAWVMANRHSRVLTRKERLRGTCVVPCSAPEQDARTVELALPLCGASEGFRERAGKPVVLFVAATVQKMHLASAYVLRLSPRQTTSCKTRCWTVIRCVHGWGHRFCYKADSHARILVLN